MKDLDKCSNMPVVDTNIYWNTPLMKKKYLWFKCIFSRLQINFIEVTSSTPQNYQKMTFSITKDREQVTKIIFHLWGTFTEKVTPLGTYNLYNSFFFSDWMG